MINRDEELKDLVTFGRLNYKEVRNPDILKLGGRSETALQEKVATTVAHSERAGGGRERHGVVRTLVTEYTPTVPTVVLEGEGVLQGVQHLD